MSHLSIKADHIDLINAHFETCKNNQQPYVLCRRRRTKADVEFDFISLDKSLDRIFEQREKEILDSAKQIYLRHDQRLKLYDVCKGYEHAGTHNQKCRTGCG